MSEQAASVLARAWRGNLRPYAYLTLAFFIMALNVVIARATHVEIPPLGLTFWRWSIASLCFLPFSWNRMREQWPLVRESWKLLALISVVMVPLGNNLIYVGLQTTVALNAGLIPVARPAIILVLSWFLFRGTVTRYQWLGIAIAMTGVVTVITRGNPAVLAGMDFNQGDLWVFGASVGIACYQVLIGRVSKALHPVVLLQVTMTLGTAWMVPAYLAETIFIRPVVPTLSAIGAIGFIAIFPSIVAVLLINAGIAALGPARMGIFNYLSPLFVAVIAIPVLGETLHWYHPVAFALVSLGILTAVRSRKRGNGGG